MNKKSTQVFIFVMLIAFLPVSAAPLWADAVFTYEIVETLPSGKTIDRTEEVFVKGHRMKISQPEKQAQIIDLDQARLTQVDHLMKKYQATDLDVLKKRFQGMEEVLRRQFAEKPAAGPAAGAWSAADPTNEEAVRVTETDETDTINGYACRKILITTPFRTVEAWVSTDVEGRADLLRLIELMQIAHGDVPLLSKVLSVESRLLATGAFPVKITTVLDGGGRSSFKEEKLLVKSDTSSISDLEFEPPSGFLPLAEPR